jgi:ubiquinone/menaquinone biosynthesis C-methylase UbiE
VEVVAGELECIPFESGRFDTAISIDTFAHFPDWMANLDELLRVVKPGGRVIVDLGSRDHIDAVAAARGVSAADVCAAELAGPDDFVLRLSVRELCA